MGETFWRWAHFFSEKYRPIISAQFVSKKMPKDFGYFLF
jgi:hypothetical protein